jgi:hypothetical protein
VRPLPCPVRVPVPLGGARQGHFCGQQQQQQQQRQWWRAPRRSQAICRRPGCGGVGADVRVVVAGLPNLHPAVVQQGGGHYSLCGCRIRWWGWRPGPRYVVVLVVVVPSVLCVAWRDAGLARRPHLALGPGPGPGPPAPCPLPPPTHTLPIHPAPSIHPSPSIPPPIPPPIHDPSITRQCTPSCLPSWLPLRPMSSPARAWRCLKHWGLRLAVPPPAPLQPSRPPRDPRP